MRIFFCFSEWFRIVGESFGRFYASSTRAIISLTNDFRKTENNFEDSKKSTESLKNNFFCVVKMKLILTNLLITLFVIGSKHTKKEVN